MVELNKSNRKLKQDLEYVGIGGWLIVYLIGLFISIFISLLYFLEIENLAVALINIILIAGIIFTLICIFKKLKLARTMGIILSFTSMGINLLALEMRAAIAGLIWGLYFIKSKRVKNTLINDWNNKKLKKLSKKLKPKN